LRAVSASVTSSKVPPRTETSYAGTLALVYYGGVATTQTIFRALTGQDQQPQLAVVISTLVIAALFMPLRRRIQSFIDWRFYRQVRRD
jgi:threonine/homoserine efflux transporter RhtA